MKPLISVILTTHNRPNLLKRALISLLSQTYKNFEILVCADESSKETKEAAFSLLRPSDSFLSAPNLKGPAETRNLGITLATGNWICFLDDDNTFPENYFDFAKNELSDAHQIHYFNYNEILENRNDELPEKISSTKKDISEISINRLLISNFIPNNDIFISTQIARNHFFDPNLQSHEDWDWLLLLKNKGFSFKHHEKYGPNRHIIHGSSRNNDAHASKSAVIDYLSIYRKWPVGSEELKEKRATLLAKMGLKIPSRFL